MVIFSFIRSKFFTVFLCCISLFASNANAQVAIGLEPIYRFADDIVGPTYNINLGVIDIEDSTGFFGGSFSVSVPTHFGGTGTLDARDSSTIPFNITVPVDRKVQDFILQFGGGLFIKVKHKPTPFIATLGLRGVFRNVKVSYLAPFDHNVYNDKYPDCLPYIPAAVNLGFNLGIGYWYRSDRFVIFPKISFGFGSGDSGNDHPWNVFPNHMDLGVNFMFVAGKKKN